MEKQQNRWTMLYKGLLVFALLGCELLLVMGEGLLSGMGLAVRDEMGNILHWALTSAIWGIGALALVRSARREGFEPMAFRETPGIAQILVVLLLVALTLTASVISWGGFKPVRELSSHFSHFGSAGPMTFFFQYIYYLFETVLITLTVAFGQEFGESRFGGRHIPWGGILLSLTWGTAHILTQGLSTGLMTMVLSLLMGGAYLLLKKNIRWVYPCFLLMFVF